MFGYMEMAYQMNPANVTSDWNVAMNIQQGVHDLDQIASDVHMMRDQIWMNQFMAPLMDYGYSGRNSTVIVQDHELRARVSALESSQEVTNLIQIVLGKWKDLTNLYESAFGRSQQINLYLEELKKVGSWFLGEMGWNEFIAAEKSRMIYVTDLTKSLIQPLSIVADGDPRNTQIRQIVDFEILPKFDELAEELAALDLKMEIGISILKGCIGLKRMDDKQAELFEETLKIREDLENKSLELPFNLAGYQKSNEKLKAEIAQMISEGTLCKQERILLDGEPEEMKAWAFRIDYRVQQINELEVENIGRLNDLKRIYELHWAKGK